MYNPDRYSVYMIGIDDWQDQLHDSYILECTEDFIFSINYWLWREFTTDKTMVVIKDRWGNEEEIVFKKVEDDDLETESDLNDGELLDEESATEIVYDILEGFSCISFEMATKTNVLKLLQYLRETIQKTLEECLNERGVELPLSISIQSSHNRSTIGISNGGIRPAEAKAFYRYHIVTGPIRHALTPLPPHYQNQV